MSERTAAELCQSIQLSPPARQLLAHPLTPQAYFRELIGQSLHEDAVQLLAHWLPKRVAVWWGCLCNQLTAPEVLPEAGREALQAALRWVVEPSETNRNAAMKAGQAEECQTPPGLLAMAAAWSGGSLGPPTLPVVIPPADHLTGQLVGCALLKAASQKQPMEYPENYRRFLGLGIEVAQGRNLWTPGGSIGREEVSGVECQLSGVGGQEAVPVIHSLLVDEKVMGRSEIVIPARGA